jgi:hypothetical protein
MVCFVRARSCFRFIASASESHRCLDLANAVTVSRLGYVRPASRFLYSCSSPVQTQYHTHFGIHYSHSLWQCALGNFPSRRDRLAEVVVVRRVASQRCPYRLRMAATTVASLSLRLTAPPLSACFGWSHSERGNLQPTPLPPPTLLTTTTRSPPTTRANLPSQTAHQNLPRRPRHATPSGTPSGEDSPSPRGKRGYSPASPSWAQSSGSGRLAARAV